MAEQLDIQCKNRAIINNAPIEQPIKPNNYSTTIVRSKEREINNDSSDDNKSGLLLVILAVIIGGLYCFT